MLGQPLTRFLGAAGRCGNKGRVAGSPDVFVQGSEGRRARGRESVCGGQGSRIQGKAAEEGTGFPKTDGIDFARVGVHFA